MRPLPQLFLTLFLIILSFLLPASAPAKVVYVSQDASGDGCGSSWENACTTITAGLAASASGDEMWVKSATYEEEITLKEYVAVYGGFLGTETEREQRHWRANKTTVAPRGMETNVIYGANHAQLDGFWALSISR